MSEILNFKNRENVLKLIAISVCALELLITLATLIYQGDGVRLTETPVTQQMAQVYIDHPERLKPDERLALNTHSGSGNQQTYLLIKEELEVIPFPWKPWILISVGAPFLIAFLILLFTKAYFQVVEPGENQTAEAQGKFISALNRLNQISTIWFMLLAIIVIFLFWYVPEIIKYTGRLAMDWLTTYWWAPATVFFVAVMILLFWMYLQYRLRVKAMNIEMELAKFKFLENKGQSTLLLGNESAKSPSIQLLEAQEVTDGQVENQNIASAQ